MENTDTHKPMETADLIRQLLINYGEDPQREGLIKTPERVQKSYDYLLSGYSQNPDEIVGDAIFHETGSNMIIVKDIEVYSLCEHHILPFFGRCHIGYIPRGQVIGVSKLGRLVDCFARRLQIQERLTQQLAEYIQKRTNAEGVGVVIECHHLCMMMRGVEKQNSCMVTSSMQGSFLRSVATRNEFLRLIHSGNN